MPCSNISRANLTQPQCFVGVQGPGARVMMPTALNPNAIPKPKAKTFLGVDAVKNTCFLCFTHCPGRGQDACQIRNVDSISTDSDRRDRPTAQFINGHSSGGRAAVNCANFDAAFSSADANVRFEAVQLAKTRKVAALRKFRS